MPTFTTNYGLSKPLVNNATDQDLWGGELNDDLDGIDGLTKTCLNWTPSSKTANFIVDAPTSGSTVTGGSKILFLCDSTLGNVTASLPAAATCSGETIAFKKTDASANTVIIDGNGSETIDGSTMQTLSNRFDYLVISSDGAGWNIISRTSVTPPDATTLIKGIVQLATAAEVLAGTDTSKVSTPSALAGNINLVANGYYKFAGGLIVQWGTTAFIGTTASATTNFTTAFPSSLFIVMTGQGTVVTGQGANNAVTAQTLSNFTMRNSTGASQTFSYIAIGI